MSHLTTPTRDELTDSDRSHVKLCMRLFDADADVLLRAGLILGNVACNHPLDSPVALEAWSGPFFGRGQSTVVNEL
ncbi:hypothetical protein [Mesorhizobium sp.]|uniref:hypothetical protein n=1 Tax=Mesorhizobium sp. TaxID=1871066 RepID=UPI0025E9849D|nr:hypothetical protein [Mesorhizobium sp.]